MLNPIPAKTVIMTDAALDFIESVIAVEMDAENTNVIIPVIRKKTILTISAPSRVAPYPNSKQVNRINTRTFISMSVALIVAVVIKWEK